MEEYLKQRGYLKINDSKFMKLYEIGVYQVIQIDKRIRQVYASLEVKIRTITEHRLEALNKALREAGKDRIEVLTLWKN